MFDAFIYKKTILNKLKFLQTSIRFVWKHLQVQTNNFSLLVQEQEDWQSTLDTLSKINELIGKIVNSGISIEGNEGLGYQIYTEPWQKWAFSEFNQLCGDLYQQPIFENDAEASGNNNIKELCALEMSLYWRLIKLSKKF